MRTECVHINTGCVQGTVRRVGSGGLPPGLGWEDHSAWDLSSERLQGEVFVTEDSDNAFLKRKMVAVH